MKKILLISLLALLLFTIGCTQASKWTFEPLDQVQGTPISFTSSNNSICTENGKPIVRMFSTTWCPHCKWVKPAFIDTVKHYTETGDIVAYLWELDTGDNVLTAQVEASVPPTEKAIYDKFNPTGSIPTFVFGCKYYRIGNYFESENNLDKEVTEFKQMIKKIVDES
ncbi:MAG: thioredoxin domain-containing protein [archaeon]|nr:thioredoxin domain-containing protein [archaeon]